MEEFLFIDNEYEKNNYYLIMGDTEKLEEKFKEVYVKLMKEYWDDDTSKWDYIDFYDELGARLEIVGISLIKPELLYHNDCFKC